jgi:regulator of protease activity HflC (stomatin/prohibitin superfamily)
MSFGWNYLTGRREYKSGAVTIYEYERGLLYKNGKLLRVLEAGRYRLWRWNHARIEVVDVRRQSAQIANQKLLTSDQVTVTINIVADYEIADVALATHSVANHQSQLYEDVQLAARNIVGSVTVDDLLEKRLEINAQLQEAVVASAAAYGIRVLAVGVKDVILAAKVRDLLMKEVEAKRVAQAMLIGAREEVAAMRALANAARLVADNPALLRLRELEVARAFSANGGNTVVMGLSENAALLKGNGAKAQTNGDAPIEDVNEE